MKKCYEAEDWKKTFGKDLEYFHCGMGVTGIDGERYCTCDGLVEGYGVKCALIKPPEQEQIYMEGF